MFSMIEANQCRLWSYSSYQQRWTSAQGFSLTEPCNWASLSMRFPLGCRSEPLNTLEMVSLWDNFLLIILQNTCTGDSLNSLWWICFSGAGGVHVFAVFLRLPGDTSVIIANHHPVCSSLCTAQLFNMCSSSTFNTQKSVPLQFHSSLSVSAVRRPPPHPPRSFTVQTAVI